MINSLEKINNCKRSFKATESRVNIVQNKKYREKRQIKLF